jgi:hypothetical protein
MAVVRSTVWMRLCGVGLVVLCLSVNTGRGSFQEVADFQGLSLGNVDGQDGWVAAGTSSAVVVDPADGDNQVLAITTDSTTAYKDLAIENGTVRMLFFRCRFEDQLNFSFGMSDRPIPVQFGDFESELNMSNSTNELRVRDSQQYEVVSTLNAESWYNVWMLIDNLGDNTQVWMNSSPGQDATGDDQLDAAGQLIFSFRNTSGGDLRNYFIKTGGGNGINSGPLLIDDIYVENTSDLNLGNPVSGLLLGDVNLDGEVNGLDVDPFVDVLLSGPYQPEADMNEDQVVNGLDVDPFVDAVVGGVQQIPEPSALLLCILALGVVGGWRKRGG